MHHFVLTSLRKIRSFNFSDTLTTALSEFLTFLSTNPRESQNKFYTLIEALKLAEEKLHMKLKNDPNLQDNQDFQENFKSFQEMSEVFTKQMKEFRTNKIF